VDQLEKHLPGEQHAPATYPAFRPSRSVRIILTSAWFMSVIDAGVRGLSFRRAPAFQERLAATAHGWQAPRPTPRAETGNRLWTIFGR
jgi:hypothetical protein